MSNPRKRKPGRPPTGRISVHVFLDKKLDEELSKVASREGVHRSVIVGRALAKELQVSVNHNDLGYLEKALEHSLTAEKLLSSAGAKSPESCLRPGRLAAVVRVVSSFSCMVAH